MSERDRNRRSGGFPLMALRVAVCGIALASLANGRTRTAFASTPITFNAARAFEYLKRNVAFGPRPPGSRNLIASRHWIIGELRQAGCSVEEDQWTSSTPIGDVRI